MTRATYFASPERLPLGQVASQHHAVSAEAAVVPLLDSFPEPAVIINAQRQVVRSNDKFERLAQQPQLALVGQRLGEALGCEHGREAPNGCGTTPACALCGAGTAIARTQATCQPTSSACRITIDESRGRDSLDLQVFTTPIELAGERYTVVALRDRSGEERRGVLERLFFHDVLNIAGSLRNILAAWPLLSREQAIQMSRRISPLTTQLVEEIRAQRDLAAAESGELVPCAELLDIHAILRELAGMYSGHAIADGKQIAIVNEAGPARVKSDGVLLKRALGNLLKNALEASAPGQVVTLGYTHPGQPRFTVHNETAMPDGVKLQVFQRSFSTKGGEGRGVGTYGARLLVQRYLGGTLAFTSVAGEGTTFVLTLPEELTADS